MIYLGGELAEFYLEAGQVQQASAFLLDSLKTFQVILAGILI